MKGEIDELKLVFGAMIILALATSLMVVVPWMLLDTAHPAGTELQPYTPQQLHGRQQYIANGCVYCHSQQPRDPKQAPDGVRGWGRPSVAADYYYDNPHLLGTMRTGPDLFNIGARQPSRDWQLGHLYQPRAYTKGSIMPAYPFLFEERRPEEVSTTDVVVNLPPEFATGKTVVASKEALDLVAYLLSLDRTYPAIQRPAAPIAKPASASGAKP
ncbi:MAG: cbb3-type cytochrome c oxidase subunit II [Burkholderiaceae bacterium]|jgi:cytochrome c oxidase cbb3-type subunit 2